MKSCYNGYKFPEKALDVHKAVNLGATYGSDDYKDLSLFAIATLAEFYGVPTDYLMWLSENKNHPDTELWALHLRDDMVEF